MESMSKRIWLFGLLFCLVSIAVPVSAQERLTVEDAVLRRGGALSPETLRGFRWRPGAQEYSHVQGDSLRIVSARDGRLVSGIALSTLQARLREKGLEELRAWPSYSWDGRETLELWTSEAQVFLSADGQSLREGWRVPAGADNLHVSPKGGAMAFNRGQSIWVLDAKRSEHVVTADTAVGIVNGRSVHRNEFGIDDGIFWSPKGNRLAFYRMDESMVSVYPLVDISTRCASLVPDRYPMAGETSHQVRVGVYTLGQDGVVWLQTGGPADHYLTNVTWSPDERFVYIAEVNRGQDTMWLNRYDAASGRLDAHLFMETDARYVEPLVGPLFVPGNDGQFLWQSQRSGHNHLYLYDTKGRLVKPLTSGNWEVLDVVGFDEGGTTVYIMSNEHGVLDRHLVSVDLRRGSRVRLTPRDGYHYVTLDTRAGRFAAFWSAFDNPGGVYCGSLKGGAVRDLLVSKDPLAGFDLPERRLVTLKAADGKTDLYGRLFVPKGAESSGAKLPTVIYVYGGPHAQLVRNTWMGGAPYWELYMAQEGYVVFVMDNRGSANRGFEFEQVIHRQLGEVELADQVQGIHYLQGLPYVDAQRMGVHGWSFGGFMTINMLLRSGEGLKVGVAGGPVIDWQWYEVMYGERYMDTPRENPEGYARANLRNYVDSLAGKRLLVVHGYQDGTVVPQHALGFLKSVVDANRVEVDFFFYPGHPHNVRGRDRVQLMRKVTDYFDVFLK